MHVLLKQLQSCLHRDCGMHLIRTKQGIVRAHADRWSVWYSLWRASCRAAEGVASSGGESVCSMTPAPRDSHQHSARSESGSATDRPAHPTCTKHHQLINRVSSASLYNADCFTVTKVSWYFPLYEVIHIKTTRFKKKKPELQHIQSGMREKGSELSEKVIIGRNFEKNS